jgi:outer membrane protein assembly factor BamA
MYTNMNRRGVLITKGLIALMYFGAGRLVYGQPQSRAEVIEEERAQKEANLSPEVEPKGQEVLERAENSVPYRLLSGQMKGFGLAFGAILPGSGFAIGPSYTRTDLLGGRLTASVEARANFNESYVGSVALSLPHLVNDRAFVNFFASHQNISEMPYYGSGPNSMKTGRSDYRFEQTNLELRPGVRLFKRLQVSAVGSFLANNVGPGHSDKFISAEQQYGPDAAPGIDHQTNFWRGGGAVQYDWRNADSTSGGKYLAQYVRYMATDLSQYNFYRVDLDATQYIPLFNHTRVIALHGASSLTDTGNGQHVPFYLQPQLGGPENLRGYRFGRFYGDNSTLVTAEYRWDASPLFQVIAFTDAGKVFDRWDQWNFHNLQSDVGFGFRVKSQTHGAFTFSTAFSHEGFQIWFRVNSIL